MPLPTASIRSSDPWITAMRHGDFATAWSISDRVLTERRARGEECSHWPRHLQYIWNGAPLDGKSVLVRCYHGLGDTIQYARFLEPLRKRASKITLWAQPALLGVLAHVRGCDVLMPLHDGAPDASYDVDIELMEVTHALRTTLDDLPGPIPYLHLHSMTPSTAATKHDRNFMRVGIAWRSGAWDPTRSIAPSALAPLSRIPDIALYSLQFPPEPLPFAATTLACRDIECMAGRMLSLDLVISVDTMVAHLAGALGLPTWVLLSECPDWRWLDDCDDSPWYPTVRLFRRCSNDWQPPLASIADALATERTRLIAARCTRSDGCRASSG